MAPFAGVRQKVLLTDDEEGQRSFYRSLGWHEVGAVGGVGEPGPAAMLRAFVHRDP